MSHGSSDDDGGGGSEGGAEGGPEPDFRRFWYDTFSSVSIVLFLYQVST